MKDSAAFDAFYAETRGELLAEAFALAGDRAAAEEAVRVGFASAARGWRRLGRRPDREAWVRSRVWRAAQRRRAFAGRASGRPDSGGGNHHGGTPDAGNPDDDPVHSPDAQATLTALGRLTPRQRRLLVADALATPTAGARGGSEPHETPGVQARPGRRLQQARAKFAAHRQVGESEIGRVLGELRSAVSEASLPAAGRLRRRARASRLLLLGLLAVLALGLVGVGALWVARPDVVRSALGVEQAAVEPTARRVPPPAPEPPTLLRGDLLTAGQAARLAPQARWAAPTTTDNTEGTGLVLPCQQTRYADPGGLAAYLRTFPARAEPGSPAVSGAQLSELSWNPRAAEAAYRRTVRWFADCSQARVQLLSTRQVERVGDAATVLVLRSWAEPVTTFTVGVARTGRVVTTVLDEVADDGPVDLAVRASLLAASVNRLCGTPGTATCAGPPRLVEVAPLPAGPAPGMLAELDLPPVPGVSAPWVGTRPMRADVNLAATRCDEADFTIRGMTHNLTRSFLVTAADLPLRFGLTQTVGLLPSERRANSFVDTLRRRLATCEERDLASQVTRLVDRGGKTTDLALYQVTAEISEVERVRYLLGIIRHGRAVSEVGFVPAAGASVSRTAFAALVGRALDRLPALAAASR